MHDDDRSTTPREPQGDRASVEPNGQPLGTIALRQVRVSRGDVQDKAKAEANPMNRLVPYLDLYGRLSDEELSRLAGVAPAVVADLRRQVVQVDRALARFTDLLPRLTDAELVRLTGATPKTIRFWRLCQPRFGMAGVDEAGWSVAQAAETLGRVQSSAELTHRPGSTGVGRSAEPPLESGVPPEGRGDGPEPRPTGTAEMRRAESGGYPAAEPRRPESSSPHPTGETPRAKYRMPTAERDAGAVASAWAAQGGAKPESGIPAKRPRTGQTQEAPAAGSREHPDARLKQRAVAQQMDFSGAPFPGYDEASPGDVPEDDGIFIGLELPDPRTLAQPGRRG
ncbi:MAG: hypothetical protein KDK70_01520 [Myxococcales bacterium]|nr:hypothetical protein [Myxococcales bacterium]